MNSHVFFMSIGVFGSASKSNAGIVNFHERQLVIKLVEKVTRYFTISNSATLTMINMFVRDKVTQPGFPRGKVIALFCGITNTSNI